MQATAYQHQSALYYNSKIKQKIFRPGDLMFINVALNTKEHGADIMGPTWEGPYRVKKVFRPGTYQLEGANGEILFHPWNAEHLKIYFL